MRPGEVVLREASRAFEVRADPARTLKELVIGRRRNRGAPTAVHALRGVSLTIEPGEAVGLVGRNGAGKTSTLRALSGIVPLDSGSVACGGRIVSLLELGAGFGADFTGRENIRLNGALHGLTKAQVEELVEPVVAFSGLGDFIDVPVRTYSSGMFVRLGFAIAAHLDADVLLIDEVLAVGDEQFQRKCLERIGELMAGGTTLVLVSHDAASIERVCRRVVVLDDGHVVFDGPTPEGLAAYRALLGVDPAEPLRQAGRATVVLEDAAGRATTVFGTGDGLRVLVERDEAGPLELAVRDDGGRELFKTRWADAPAGRVAYEVAALPLLGGSYDVVVAGRSAAFSVTPTGDGGAVDLRGSWTSVRVPA